MNIWIPLLLGGLFTYLTRLSFFLLFKHESTPAWFRKALFFVPPAILAAIVFPELLMVDGQLLIAIGNDRLIAGALAALVAWKTRNSLLTIISGIAALLLLSVLT